MNKILLFVQAAILSTGVIVRQIFFELTEKADTYFVMNLGQYILEHGFPYVDPFTIHENLQLVAQQWLSGVLFWEAYKNFGVDGLLIVDTIIGAATILIYWRLCLFVSEGNKLLSFVLSFIVGLLIVTMIVPRPHIFSTLLLLIEVFMLENFTRTQEFKFLLTLPLVSLALINLHAAIWLMSLVVCLPFLFVKNFRHSKLLLAAMAAIFLCGLINPYGVEAMTYVFRSYGVEIISDNIPEMFTPSAHNLQGKIFYCVVAFIIISLTKFKIPLRYILLSGGIIFMSIMHWRNLIMFYFLATFPLSYVWRNFKPPKILAKDGELLLTFFLLIFFNTAAIVTLLKDNLNRLSMPLEILFFASVIFILYNLLALRVEGRPLHPLILPRKILSLFVTALIICGIFLTTTPEQKNKSEEPYTAAMKFLLRSERSENISLYVPQGIGGMAGTFGIKYYIDSRSEVFIPANNGQKNILEEYLDFTRGKIYYKDFFSRYDFTHIILTSETAFLYNQLTDDKNFRVVYESEHVEGYEVIHCKIFIPPKKD